MLTLDRLQLTDFGPYRGQQEIRLTRDRGVYIVYGPNGRGKTNLHNAFRYALYGYVLDRRREGKLHDIANSEAAKSQGFKAFKTVLDFRVDDIPFRLTRSYDERSQPPHRLLLERDGTPFSQEDSQRALAKLAPRSVSQFFLFDGEQLRQYEDLLDHESEDGALLEQAIERVLGVPIIDNARIDLVELGRAAEKQLTAQYAAHRETERLAGSLKEAQDVREALVESQSALSKRMSEARERIDELEALLREQKKSERMLGQLDELRGQADELELQERQTAESLAECAVNAWKAVLAPSASVLLHELETRLEAAEKGQQTVIAGLRDLGHLQDHEDCPVCHRDLEGETRTALLKELATEVSGDNAERAEATITLLRRQERILRAIASEDPRLVADRDKQLRSVRLKKAEVSEEIRRLETDLAEIGEASLRATTSERNERLEQVARDKQRHEEEAERLREHEAQIDRLKNLLKAAAVQPDPTIELRDQITKALSSLFDGSIDAYRLKLRRRVEERASEVFRDLTGEPDYVGLQITDGYGLRIIDKDGDVVRRSAGYEHLVALSLITALQDNAAVRGPVIMDYPFGRLDTENTSRVVAALPRMARQVVLLSFDGEFDRAAAMQALGSDLVAEFELDRVTSKHTRIESRRTF